MTEQSTDPSPADQRTATRAAQALADDHEKTVKAQRETIERLAAELSDLRASYAILRRHSWLRRLIWWNNTPRVSPNSAQKEETQV